MDHMSKKIASNDKILENISTRMDTFTFAIKNQLSFNKMIESQIAQLVAAVPPANKGKISGQQEDLETTNLVDIHNAVFYYTQPLEGRWIDYSLPDKKGDLGRPIIPLSIGPHIFQEAVCDFGASVNIMPKVIYDKILGDPCCTQICVCSLQISHSTTQRNSRRCHHSSGTIICFYRLCGSRNRWR
jgi:hypothetical protein